MYATDTLGFMQDCLSGLAVRLDNYLNLDTELEERRETEAVLVPYAVLVHDDGLDYDMDGNAYFDDYPGDHYVSGHRTRKGAEAEAQRLEEAGIEKDRIQVVERYDAHRYELKYRPIQE
jgi:hypothetical protein